MGLLAWGRRRAADQTSPAADAAPPRRNGAAPRVRERVEVFGRVVSVTPSDQDRGPSVTVGLEDAAGPVLLVWLGRRAIDGIAPGTVLRAEGRMGSNHGVRRIFNPAYTLLEVPAGRAG